MLNCLLWIYSPPCFSLWYGHAGVGWSYGGENLYRSFDGNGANASIAPISVSSEGYYGTLPELTRPNYVFDGWYSFKSGGIKITETTKVLKPSDHTLYAQWRGSPVEVELDAAGGKVSKTKIVVYYGSKYLGQLPIPTRTSYRFDGWYTSEAGGDKVTIKSIYDENGPDTLYARWTEQPVKVIFIAFNGEVYERIAAYGMEYGELPKPVKEGYTFGGWYKYKDYRNNRDNREKEIKANTIVQEIAQVKLYARWYPVSEDGTSGYY